MIMNSTADTEFDQLHALFQKDKALNVVSKDKPKGNASSELPNKKEKADIPKGKHKVHSEVPVLRSKRKPEVKAKASAFFPICFSGHFYVVVFSITNTTSMTILDNMDSGATYDSKYKQPCDLLKKLFASHLRLYGHERHSKIGRLKARIPKLKWKTKANVKDCGIFTMLHMESYMVKLLNRISGLVAESKQSCDMLRATKNQVAYQICYTRLMCMLKR
ncbi:ulp1 protease family, C-terminal catalytic domain-containing protein [Tanacetum coccineum]